MHEVSVVLFLLRKFAQIFFYINSRYWFKKSEQTARANRAGAVLLRFSGAKAPKNLSKCGRPCLLRFFSHLPPR